MDKLSLEEAGMALIKNADDRRTVAAILADNGYSVKIDRVTVGKTVKGAVVYWKDEEKKEK